MMGCRNQFSLLHFPNFKFRGIHMERKIIGLVAAMPEEIKPLLKQVGAYEKSSAAGFNLYRFSIHGRSCRLIESGIGVGRAGKAAKALIASEHPEAIISFGFGGAVRPGMAVGDLAVARSIRLYRGRYPDAREAIVLPVPAKVRQALETVCNQRGCAVRQGDFLTSETILNKKKLAMELPQEVVSPVLDMETWAVAQVAAQGGIPLLAIRAVSDAADEELGFCISEFTDSGMNIRISKILWTIARKPRIIPQLIRLSGNSRMAGKNLATAVRLLLETDMEEPAPNESGQPVRST
jgi:adenosylhomocysteine nucleosidase